MLKYENNSEYLWQISYRDIKNKQRFSDSCNFQEDNLLSVKINYLSEHFGYFDEKCSGNFSITKFWMGQHASNI